MANPFEIKSVYSFDVYPSAILGTNYQNVTVLAILDFQTAVDMGQDVTARHINVYPTLPDGTPDDPTATDYVLIQTSAGIKTVLGLSWINLSTITLINARRCTVVLENMSSTRVTDLRNALISNGFDIFSLTLNPL